MKRLLAFVLLGGLIGALTGYWLGREAVEQVPRTDSGPVEEDAIRRTKKAGARAGHADIPAWLRGQTPRPSEPTLPAVIWGEHSLCGRLW